MNFFKRFTLSFSKHWLSFRYTDYDLYDGTDVPNWSGFHLALGFISLRYQVPLSILNRKTK